MFHVTCSAIVPCHCIASWGVPELLINTFKKFTAAAMFLQSLKKCNPAKEHFEMLVSRGITPGNYWNIVCLCNKIVRKVLLKRLKLQCWLYLQTEITLLCFTDLLTRSCRLILYGSVGLTISNISSCKTKDIAAIQFLVECYNYWSRLKLPLRKYGSWVLRFHYCELIIW